MKGIIYKKCPCKTCQTIQGFALDNPELKKDRAYRCCYCSKETKLSRMIESTEKEFKKQNKLRLYSKFYK